jgi:hypothetical protein
LPRSNTTDGTSHEKKIFACLSLTLALSLFAASAFAKGCIKGAVVGAAAGHHAGHGYLGAAAGCVIGRETQSLIICRLQVG